MGETRCRKPFLSLLLPPGSSPRPATGRVPLTARFVLCVAKSGSLCAAPKRRAVARGIRYPGPFWASVLRVRSQVPSPLTVNYWFDFRVHPGYFRPYVSGANSQVAGCLLVVVVSGCPGASRGPSCDVRVPSPGLSLVISGCPALPCPTLLAFRD